MRSITGAMLLALAAVLTVAGTGCGPAKGPKVGGINYKQIAIPDRAPELRAATDFYGALVVREGEFSAQSPTKAWSAWWLPLKDPYLFESPDGGMAPLQKYDATIKFLHGEDAGAAAFERDKIFDPNAGGWEGLCDAWSVASLLEPEPTHPVTIGNVTLNVGDLKAMIVKSYELTAGARKFGQRFNGDRQSVFEDIYPDQFHRFVQAELFERGRPFIMDKDPGVAVWNTPVWDTTFRIARDPGDPRVMHVTAWLKGASPFVPSYDYVGTLSVAFEYTYDLVGIPQDDGSLLVTFGHWTGESMDYHPDFVTSLPAKAGHHSKNASLKTPYVDELARDSH